MDILAEIVVEKTKQDMEAEELVAQDMSGRDGVSLLRMLLGRRECCLVVDDSSWIARGQWRRGMM